MTSEFLTDMRRWLESQGHGTGTVTFEDAVGIVSARAKDEVSSDIASGTVPASVRTFADLHDHVDANGYGGAFDWPSMPSDMSGPYGDDFCRFWNAVQNEVNAWLAAGRPRE